jgi:hypothetical protein
MNAKKEITNYKVAKQSVYDKKHFENSTELSMKHHLNYLLL